MNEIEKTMTKKSLSDMLKDEVGKDPNEEVEGKVLRRHQPTKADLETELQTITTDRDQLKQELEAITAHRDQLKQELEAITTERDQLKQQVTQTKAELDVKQAHIQQLQAYLEQAQSELKNKAEIIPHKKPIPRVAPRPIGSNESLSRLSNQNISWFD